MSGLVHVLALAAITVSAVGAVVTIFRAPSIEEGWGGGKYIVPLPVLIGELITAIRDERRPVEGAST